MQILLDNIIYSKEQQGGISNYWKELTVAMQHQDDFAVKFFEEQNADENSCRQTLKISPEQLIQHPKPKSLVLARLLSISANQEGPFLYHSSFYRALKSNHSFVEVTTVHDFIHNYYLGRLNRLLHNKLKYSAIRRSKGIICVSHNTYNDLKKFCPTGPHQKVEVIHCGVSDDYYPLTDNNNKVGIPERFLANGYMLYVGSRAPYKNFNFVLSLLKEMPTQHLVVVGSPFFAEEIKPEHVDLLDRVLVLSNINNERLNELYNSADALLYPSSYEGFGIPVIEAMKAGCPVLALDRSSISEIAKGAGLLFDALDQNAFKKQMELIKVNSEFKKEIIANGIKQARKFSWKRCGEITANFYREIYK